MGRLESAERVKCPQCGRQEFDAIPGSECFCGCGAAFRILTDTGRVVEIKVMDETIPWSRARKQNLGLRGSE